MKIVDDLLAGPRRNFDWDFDDIEFSSEGEASNNDDGDNGDDNDDDDDDDDPAWKPSMVISPPPVLSKFVIKYHH